MKRSQVIVIVLCGAAVLAFLLFWTTGLPFRHDKIEEIRNPIGIQEVRQNGLLSQDGRILPLRFIKEIQGTNEIFRSVLARGVEVMPDGTLIGLLDVRHWCGNDPIRRHTARVDLSAVALYLGAVPTADVPPWILEWGERRFYHGIDPGHYGSIRIIEEFIRKQTPTMGWSESAAHGPPPAQP